MTAPTQLTRRYLITFAIRLSVFLLIAGVYLRDKTLLNVTRDGPLFWPLSLLWLFMLFAMLAQLNPNSKLTTGCLKQYRSSFAPAEHYDREKLKEAVREQNRGALKVALVWLAFNAVFGVMFVKNIISVSELLLLSAFYYLSDLICVLFFCPFQTFLMHNRCCVNCRIFAWGSWMMATPLSFIPHLYAQTLVAAAILVFAVWEYRFRRHPERFWFGSNRHLQCSSCKEQLCRYKHPRSPYFRSR